MTRNIDHRLLGRLRQGQGEIANHIIDEFAAGRLSRRDFIRRATVVGISVPALGVDPGRLRQLVVVTSRRVRSASASGAAGAVITGRHRHADRGDQPGDRGRPGRPGHARADRRVPVPVRPDPEPDAGARHQLDAELDRGRLDVQDPPGGQVPQRRRADRRRRGVHLQAADEPDRAARTRCPRSAGCSSPSGVVQGRRLHGRLPPGGPERELPVPDLLRQLQHDHHPEQLQPGQLAEHVHRHRPVRAQLLHAEGRRDLHPQRVVLGHQGAALADPVHLLRHAGRVGPRADRREHRRPRAVLRVRRRGAAGRQLQRHQAEVQRAPRAVDAQRPGPVHRPAGAPGDRADPQPPRDRHRAVQGLRRHRQRQPVRARLPVHEHQRRPARAEHQPGQVAAGGGGPLVGLHHPAHHRGLPGDPRIRPDRRAGRGGHRGEDQPEGGELDRSTTARPRSGTPTGWTRR